MLSVPARCRNCAHSAKRITNDTIHTILVSIYRINQSNIFVNAARAKKSSMRGYALLNM